MITFDKLIAPAMVLARIFVGALVVSLVNLIGIAGWIAGVGFVLLVLAIVYLDETLMKLEMKYVSPLSGT